MSPTSAGGGTNTKTGGEHISHLVETPRAKLEQRRYKKSRQDIIISYRE
ncbi:hypothetical protein [Selenomonas sp. AE3005]|nr:hypothetical protein [Selenomonas sp. AE3005]